MIIDKKPYELDKLSIDYEEDCWLIKCGTVYDAVKGKDVFVWQVGSNDGSGGFDCVYYTASTFEAIVNWMSYYKFNCSAHEPRVENDFQVVEDDDEDNEDDDH